MMFTARNAHSASARPVMIGSLYFNPDNIDELWEELRGKLAIENFDYRMRQSDIRDCYLLKFGQEIVI